MARANWWRFRSSPGAAHLVVKGKAQTAGFKGSTILMRNLSSGKDFRAHGDGKETRSIVGDSRAMKRIVIADCSAVRGCRLVHAAPKKKQERAVKAAVGAGQVHRASFAARKPPTARFRYWIPVDPSGAVLGFGCGSQRSRRVDDIVTIVVQESASAVSTGAIEDFTQVQREQRVTALAGLTKATGPWANLANLGGQTTLDGQGTTSRTTTLTTTVSARVTHVLRNGNLVVEGTKNVRDQFRKSDHYGARRDSPD